MASGLFAGFLFSGILLQFANLRVLFSVAIVFILIPVLIVALASHEPRRKLPLKVLLVKTDLLREELKAMKFLKDKLKFIFSMKFVAEGLSTMKNLFVPLIVINIMQQSESVVSVLLAASLIPYIIIEKYISVVIDKTPGFFFLGGHKRRVLGLSLFLMLITTFMIPFAKNPWVLGILLVLSSMGYSMLTPMLNLVLLKYYPHNPNEGSGLLHLSTQAGRLILISISLLIVFVTGSVLNVFFVPGAIILILFGYLIYDSIKSGKVEPVNIFHMKYEARKTKVGYAAVKPAYQKALENYVATALKAGLKRYEVEQNLVRKGWNKSRVDEIIQKYE